MLSIWRLGFYRLMERSAQNWTRPSLMLLVLGHWAPLPAPGHLLATVAIAHCHYWLDESYLRWLCVRKLILGFVFGQTKVLTEFPAGDRAQQVNCLLSKHEDLSLEPTSVTPVLRAVNWGRGEVWQVDPAGSLASCSSGIGESCPCLRKYKVDSDWEENQYLLLAFTLYTHEWLLSRFHLPQKTQEWNHFYKAINQFFQCAFDNKGTSSGAFLTLA